MQVTTVRSGKRYSVPKPVCRSLAQTYAWRAAESIDSNGARRRLVGCVSADSADREFCLVSSER